MQKRYRARSTTLSFQVQCTVHLPPQRKVKSCRPTLLLHFREVTSLFLDGVLTNRILYFHYSTLSVIITQIHISLFSSLNSIFYHKARLSIIMMHDLPIPSQNSLQLSARTTTGTSFLALIRRCRGHLVMSL